MPSIDRRRFVSSLGHAGALLASSSWLQAIGYAPARSGPARAFLRQAPARVLACEPATVLYCRLTNTITEFDTFGDFDVPAGSGP